MLAEKDFLFFPSQVSNLGGESVREGGKRKSAPACSRGVSKKGRTTPFYLEGLKRDFYGFLFGGEKS